MDQTVIDRARGALLGQLVGDAFGAQMEFMSPEEVKDQFANHTVMGPSAVHGTIAGQITDDSEMALCLARSIIAEGEYSSAAAFAAYREWGNSQPFSMGMATRSALAGRRSKETQANGALMRISPLGIYGWHAPLHKVGTWAATDAALTHPHAVTRAANSLYAMAIALGVRGRNAAEIYRMTLTWAKEMRVPEPVLTARVRAQDSLPEDFVTHQGWVLIALQNAFYQLLHAPSGQRSVRDSVLQGGDTDTNAAIAGALAGAAGASFPGEWVDTVLDARPTGQVKYPRPQTLWAADALQIADQLAHLGAAL